MDLSIEKLISQCRKINRMSQKSTSKFSSGNRYLIGFDIGSVSLNTVIMDEDHNIVEDFYEYIHGKPFNVLKDRLDSILEKYPVESVSGFALTGTGGKLASGLIGTFIATRWTFAAEVDGCQAEGGSAAAMAAAALVTLADGNLQQAVAASSMAFQSMLGLICDPVANRVEVPCLGKNVLAASNAVSCANMALADYDPVIPFDEVIETAQRVAAQMPRELRCTALGGLSITKTSLAIEARLAAKKNAACGTPTCGCTR